LNPPPRTEGTVGNERQDHPGDRDELQRRPDVLLREAARPVVQRFLRREDHHGEAGDHDRRLALVPRDEGAHQHGDDEGGEARVARRLTGLARHDLLEREGGEGDGEQQRTQRGGGVGGDAADHRPERVGADTAEVVPARRIIGQIAPLPDQPDQRAEACAREDSGEQLFHAGRDGHRVHARSMGGRAAHGKEVRESVCRRRRGWTSCWIHP